jgi:hypothetical protein
VFEEALNVRLSSGGGTRRKRGKAARLQPAGEDTSSTSQLFDLTRLVANEGMPTGVATPETPAPPNGDAPVEPLLRYEWRNAAGETLIVEAAWPTAPGVVPGNGSADAGANGNGHGNGNGHPKLPVDLRQVTELH